MMALSLFVGSVLGEPLDGKDFSFGYWLNGWRKHANDRSPEVLCFETGHYGLTLNMADLTKAAFGSFDDDTDYLAAHAAGAQRLAGLSAAELVIEVEAGGEVYRAVTCRAGIDRDVKRLNHVRLWESGRLVQHFELLGLVLRDAGGRRLDCDARLDIVVWPRSFALTLVVVPNGTEVLKDATLRLKLKGTKRHWHEETRLAGVVNSGREEALTLTCAVEEPSIGRGALSVQLRAADNRQVDVSFVPAVNGHVARINRLRRRWKVGYTDVRHYDDFSLSVSNSGKDSALAPFLLELRRVANITGLCPILCDAAGVPTGIPVQLSKNWHHDEMGCYLRAYALLPAKPGRSTYTLRVVYGFYGTLPSASHAQLSLVGYRSGNGRWDQLAIGCWGETMCLDMDQSCVADDYYGPNEAFRQHLSENPRSWKTVHREAVGNDLKIKVAGGTLLNRYPVIIRPEGDRVAFSIEGGVGYVPVRFEGLKSATGYVLSRRVGADLVPLDQSVHGNDFWQTDYDAASQTYKITYNLPLDGIQKSIWGLQQQ